MAVGCRMVACRADTSSRVIAELIALFACDVHAKLKLLQTTADSACRNYVNASFPCVQAACTQTGVGDYPNILPTPECSSSISTAPAPAPRAEGGGE